MPPKPYQSQKISSPNESTSSTLVAILQAVVLLLWISDVFLYCVSLSDTGTLVLTKNKTWTAVVLVNVT